ncbi:hypothetical protein [Paenibacillus glufosinatiresistens]|uniref:hypothetical protein n=1 Tax=Paenibacillus glufosinatiresistens TaxID=3070657 RepID=UPI00286E834F|nr:hypothetical protein [Paenibacillus sp. YX.27]
MTVPSPRLLVCAEAQGFGPSANAVHLLRRLGIDPRQADYIGSETSYEYFASLQLQPIPLPPLLPDAMALLSRYDCLLSVMNSRLAILAKRAGLRVVYADLIFWLYDPPAPLPVYRKEADRLLESASGEELQELLRPAGTTYDRAYLEEREKRSILAHLTADLSLVEEFVPCGERLRAFLEPAGTRFLPPVLDEALDTVLDSLPAARREAGQLFRSGTGRGCAPDSCRDTDRGGSPPDSSPSAAEYTRPNASSAPDLPASPDAPFGRTLAVLGGMSEQNRYRKLMNDTLGRIPGMEMCGSALLAGSRTLPPEEYFRKLSEYPVVAAQPGFATLCEILYLGLTPVVLPPQNAGQLRYTRFMKAHLDPSLFLDWEQLVPRPPYYDDWAYMKRVEAEMESSPGLAAELRGLLEERLRSLHENGPSPEMRRRQDRFVREQLSGGLAPDLAGTLRSLLNPLKAGSEEHLSRHTDKKGRSTS